MASAATRQIFWNLDSDLNRWLLYLLFLGALIIFCVSALGKTESFLHARKDPNRPLSFSLRRFLTYAVLQWKVLEGVKPGIIHSLFYLGFLVLLLATTVVFVDYDLGWHIYRGNFYLGLKLSADLFGFGILAGTLAALCRRYLERDDRLHNSKADNALLIALPLLVLQGFCLEGLRVHATADPYAGYYPVGRLFSLLFAPLSSSGTANIHFVLWWFHSLTFFAVLALLPYTKFFHLITSAINVAFIETERIPPPAFTYEGDIEQLMEQDENFSCGRGTIEDYTRAELFDLEACTACGRCQDACPAYAAGKPLSPKWLILDTRHHAWGLKAVSAWGRLWSIPGALRKTESFLLKHLGLKWNGLHESADGGFAYHIARAKNPEVQKSARRIGAAINDRVAGDVIDQQLFWSCTTCMACVEACPVGIQHLTQIAGNRRNMVLMNGELPPAAQAALRALENRGNPYGPAAERTRWAAGLEVPIVSTGQEVEYLYWVGCVSAYDPRKQKIARAIVSLMQKAGLSFGILGDEERCNGDFARRMGEEYLFQKLAKANLETLRKRKFRKIVTGCPHCYNVFKNEYPLIGPFSADGRAVEVIHHSELLAALVQTGRLRVRETAAKPPSLTFHDPCYLGRYNQTYSAPRSVLQAAGHAVSEMAASRNKAFCCGGGGRHLWMDLKSGGRVNELRVKQALETQQEEIATACPYCVQMLEDGLKAVSNDSCKVRDIAEILLEAVD